MARAALFLLVVLPIALAVGGAIVLRLRRHHAAQTGASRLPELQAALTYLQETNASLDEIETTERAIRAEVTRLGSRATPKAARF